MAAVTPKSGMVGLFEMWDMEEREGFTLICERQTPFPQYGLQVVSLWSFIQ